jgi:hypothetical protein
MKKVLHITPHLSTGGLPQFLLSLLRSTNDLVENYCVEYACHSLDFVVQRNQVIELMTSRFHSLPDDKFHLLNLIKEIRRDLFFLIENLLNKLFTKSKVSLDRIFRKLRSDKDLRTITLIKNWDQSNLSVGNSFVLKEFFSMSAVFLGVIAHPSVSFKILGP